MCYAYRKNCCRSNYLRKFIDIYNIKSCLFRLLILRVPQYFTTLEVYFFQTLVLKKKNV